MRGVEEFTSAPFDVDGLRDFQRVTGVGSLIGIGFGDGCAVGRGGSNGAHFSFRNAYGTGYCDERGAGHGCGTEPGACRVGYDYIDHLFPPTCAHCIERAGSRDLTAFCGEPVFYIDGIPMLIDHVRGNFAKGRILRQDLSTTPCYVAKQGAVFAHGYDLREAVNALRDKLHNSMSEEERIDAFLAEFSDPDEERPNREFFTWHHRLTGSCEMGRREFARQHGVDVEDGRMTARAFLELTKGAYGGGVIRKILERVNNDGAD